MSACLVCLRPLDVGEPGDAYHARCAKRLFGTTRVPRTDSFTAAALRAAVPAKTRPGTSPGGRPQYHVDVATDTRRLELAPEHGRYVLKPQAAQLPQLPENELLTMRLAELAGIAIPACGLLRLPAGSLAYIVRHNNEAVHGVEPLREGFEELAGSPVGTAPAASAELCAEIARRGASEPLVAVLTVYRAIVVAWWTGHTTLRLDDFAFITGSDGVRRVAPAGDLVCARLFSPDDRLAMPIGGRRDHITRTDWLRFGDGCGLRPRIVERVLAFMVSSFDDALELVERSLLNEDAKVAYAELLGRRTALLEKG